MTQQNATFRTVMRGYDPAEVERVFAELQHSVEQARSEANEQNASLQKLNSQIAQLQEQANGYRTRIAALSQEQKNQTAPTFADLGEHIGALLQTASDQAADLRNKAQAEAERTVNEANAAADQARAAADRYVAEVTSKTDAESTRTIEAAKRQADEILDYADREATARREEAEAVFEHQRARAAAAAADFERTLAERRDKASEEFASQMQVNEQALAMSLERQAAIEAESERTLAEARSQAAGHLKAAQEEAAQQVESARMAAEKIRRESERELQAATSRRDAITAQLTNVRQMLATLGGVAVVNPMGEEVAEAPAVQAEAAAPAEQPEAEELVEQESIA